VPDQAAAEYMYSRQSQVWKLPALWYTFTAGPVQFFAIDSNDIGAEQLAWLDDAIGRSTARWKIVYGHVPLVIAMQHTPRGYPRSVQEWRDKLMPIFKGRVDLYLAGHHHSLQHLKPLDGVALVISGAGGRAGYPIDPKSPEAFFADNQHGFAVLDITNDDIGLTLVNADGKTLYTASVAKR
jgi:hypothetical protein